MTRHALAACLSFLLLAPSALADGEDPKETLAKKAKSKLRKLESGHTKLAKWCFSRGLQRAGCRHFAEVLLIDPDDRTARKALGYKKGKSGWELAGQMPKIDKIKGDQRKKQEEALEKLASGIAKQAARTYYDLAKEAKALKLEDIEKQYLNRVIGFDSNHEDAREALGYRKVDGRWTVARQSNWVRAKDQSTVDERQTKYESELGIKLTKVNSKRVWIASHFSPKITKEMVHHGNAAIFSFHNLFALKKFLPRVSGGTQIKMVFVKNESVYKAFIDKFSDGDSRRKSFIKGLSFAGIDAENLQLNQFKNGRDDKKDRVDRVIYLAGNRLAHAICGYNAPPWIAEGVSWGLTLRIVGTKENFSVALADSSAAYGAKDWNDHTKWRDYLREMVLLNDAPHPSAVLVTRDWNSINGEKAAYAWSMVDFLWETMPEKFAKYCAIIGEDSKTPVEKACREAFGWGMAELDAAWKTYVRENY